jgi:hypothetical protein
MNMIFKRDENIEINRQHWGHSTIIQSIESKKKLIQVEFIRAAALVARTEKNISFWLHTIQNI